jgi:hypothetical protein
MSLMALCYKNLECTTSKFVISFQYRIFRGISLVSNGKISNIAEELACFFRIRVHIDPEEDGIKFLESVIYFYCFVMV